MPVENCSPLCEFARGAQRRSCGGRPPDRLKTDKARILTPLGFFANSAWKSVPFGMPLLLQVTKGKTRGALFGMTLLLQVTKGKTRGALFGMTLILLIL